MHKNTSTTGFLALTLLLTSPLLFAQSGSGILTYTQPIRVFGFQSLRMISKLSVSSERNCSACASRSAKNCLQAAL